MCFVAMPFGRRSAEAITIDFDRTWQYIRQGTEQAGLEAVRADFEPGGGFIHKPMLERLLVAEYVIADMTMANPNVMYEVGVRHGASDRATLLVCATSFIDRMPFDVKPLRVISYELGADGSLADKSGAALAQIVCERLGLARSGQLSNDNPIVQITAWKPAGSIEHSKTDVFLERLQFTGALGERIKRAVAIRNQQEAIERLATLEEEIVNLPREVAQVHTALLGVYLGYREKKAYDAMASLFQRFPRELKRTTVAREQYALALNRLAEDAVGQGRHEDADTLRARALASLDEIPSGSTTSETYGIRGRIYKAWHDSLSQQGGSSALRAQSMLQAAIETYEQGFRSDLRDYYPGVNAVTLRLLRGSEDDRAVLAYLTPVVRYSVDCAPPPKNDEERYWQAATKLELATADKDWTGARAHLLALLAIDVEPWLRETTAKNLERQQKACGDDWASAGEIARIASELRD
jgi:hypothetical protein